MSKLNIPMVDLKGQYQSLKKEIDNGIQDVLNATSFILGPNVQALEKEVADYCGVKHAIGVASGTDALHLALLAADIGPGDEVITSPFTFIATAEAIAYVGAKPVFVDINPDTFNIDPDLIEAAITDKTKAVMPVHMFGQSVDMDPIAAICKKHELKIIEDCAQSFGAEYGGKKSGAYGDLGCFSFFPSKNLGAFGDGGMVITNDDTMADNVRMYRNHGSKVRYYHSCIGYNSRLDEMQAVILRVKLKHIDEFNSNRYKNAQAYTNKLKDSGITAPFEDGKGTHVYHQYTIMHDKRDAIHQALTDRGIASAIYYPVPLHRQEVFAEDYKNISLPNAEAVSERVVSLPMFPELIQEQIQQIMDTVLSAI